MSEYRSACCYSSDLVMNAAGVMYSEVGLCPECGETCDFNIFLEGSDIHDNVEKINGGLNFTKDERRVLVDIKEKCMVAVMQPKPCDRCGGIGELDNAEPGDIFFRVWKCPSCRGTGNEMVEVSLGLKPRF